MANGSGAAIAGVIIGIIVAAQVGSIESADLDADSAPDENVDSTWDDDDSSAVDDDDDSTPQAVPTQVDGGLPAAAAPLTALDGGLEILPSDSGLELGDTPPVLSLGRNGVEATFCAMPAPSSCCPTTVVTGAPPWLRWAC